MMPAPPDLATISTALAGVPIRSRFAPSVTGFLHLGHVVNAVYVWGLTRALGGEVLVRLEDHDRGRYRPEFEHSILVDLEWLGMTSDIAMVSRQSDHSERYAKAADELGAAGGVDAGAGAGRSGVPRRAPPGSGRPPTRRDRRVVHLAQTTTETRRHGEDVLVVAPPRSHRVTSRVAVLRDSAPPW